MDDLVTCYSGYTYAERPAAFMWQGERKSVKEILSRERIPQGWRFIVSTPDELVFELLYFEDLDDWQIQPT